MFGNQDNISQRAQEMHNFASYGRTTQLERIVDMYKAGGMSKAMLVLELNKYCTDEELKRGYFNLTGEELPENLRDMSYKDYLVDNNKPVPNGEL